MKFAVFASGNGTNLQAMIDAVKAGEITAELALVFSDNRKAQALKRAEEAGIKTLALEKRDYATPQSFERDIVIYLREHEIDFIVLAGYMKLLSPFFIKEFPSQIINIHPSLLPSFKGIHGIKDTFTYGCKTAGITVHFVDDKMDHGPIIIQESIKVRDDDTLDTLTERIHELEHKTYPKIVQMHAEGRLKIKGRKVQILEK
jgi:phosphoribosylglycinamide formyltransferase 1